MKITFELKTHKPEHHTNASVCLIKHWKHSMKKHYVSKNAKVKIIHILTSKKKLPVYLYVLTNERSISMSSKRPKMSMDFADLKSSLKN